MITIRRSTPSDVEAIMRVYDAARRYMRANGNATQWVNGYPQRELVEADIAAGHGFVGLDGRGNIVMAFAFIVGDDPTYSVIEQGAWLNNHPYGTIHRLGSDGSQRGVFEACIDYCRSLMPNLRLDTHAENATMHHCALKAGFVRCGIIYVADGTPRVAYQLPTAVQHE